MKGIQFVTDDQGAKTAVLISLAEWGDVWEDIYDILVSESRHSEPIVSRDTLEFIGNRISMQHDRRGRAGC